MGPMSLLFFAALGTAVFGGALLDVGSSESDGDDSADAVQPKENANEVLEAYDHSEQRPEKLGFSTPFLINGTITEVVDQSHGETLEGTEGDDYIAVGFGDAACGMEGRDIFVINAAIPYVTGEGDGTAVISDFDQDNDTIVLCKPDYIYTSDGAELTPKYDIEVVFSESENASSIVVDGSIAAIVNGRIDIESIVLTNQLDPSEFLFSEEPSEGSDFISVPEEGDVFAVGGNDVILGSSEADICMVEKGMILFTPVYTLSRVLGIIFLPFWFWMGLKTIFRVAPEMMR